MPRWPMAAGFCATVALPNWPSASSKVIRNRICVFISRASFFGLRWYATGSIGSFGSVREPDGIDQFFVILAVFVLDPDDIVARADAFAQAGLFDILARLIANLLDDLLLDGAAVADGLVGQA